MNTILFTGGSGMVGQAVAKLLKQEGYIVRNLVRDKNKADGINSFYWNYTNQEIDVKAFGNLDYIINLAGANVAKRWNDKYKVEIYESRIKSTNFLFEFIKKNNIPLKKFISASATGFYGDSPLSNREENSPAANDFLAQVCKEWEKAALQFNSIGIPVCIFRIGVVITPGGGFVKQVSAPMKYNLGAHLGTGKQYISWIALSDLSKLFLFAIQNSTLEGIFNATASTPLTLEQIDNIIASYYHKKIWLPNVPAWALKLALGEMSSFVLGNTNVSNDKIKSAGFVFGVEEFRKALDSN